MNTLDWLMPLSYWALLAGVSYLGLFVLIISVVIPASKPSTLPEKYFELISADRKPWLYRLSIVFDVLAWIALSGFFITYAGMLIQRDLLVSLYIGALAIVFLSGLIGAGLRLVVTPSLAKRYREEKNSNLKAFIVESYETLLSILNALFSIGGLFVGGALLLVVWSAWPTVILSHWVLILFGIAGIVSIAKGALELLTGNDFGPLGLLGGIMMIVSFFGIALRLW